MPQGVWIDLKSSYLAKDACKLNPKYSRGWKVLDAGCEDSKSRQRKIRGCNTVWCNYEKIPLKVCQADFQCGGNQKCKGTGTQMVNGYESIINGKCVDN